MADNTTLNQGSGGDLIATDDVNGVKFQRNKITLGNDGVNDGDLSKTNPMPVYSPNVTPTDISGTITAGGTAQTLAASNSSIHGWLFRNNSLASLWVSDITTAVQSQPSLEIKPGEYFESPYGTANALSIIGPTTGQSFTGRAW